jgi:hypothetical protein
LGSGSIFNIFEGLTFSLEQAYYPAWLETAEATGWYLARNSDIGEQPITSSWPELEFTHAAHTKYRDHRAR